MLTNGQAPSHFKLRETNSLDKRLSPVGYRRPKPWTMIPCLKWQLAHSFQIVLAVPPVLRSGELIKIPVGESMIYN
jgi:hypothetical protein